MKKIIPSYVVPETYVTSCYHCPHYVRDEFHDEHCKKANKDFSLRMGQYLPDWCPLETLIESK